MYLAGMLFGEYHYTIFLDLDDMPEKDVLNFKIRETTRLDVLHNFKRYMSTLQNYLLITPFSISLLQPALFCTHLVKS